ncbi:MAG: T9SS type A sorting domain-containing protein [Saprospiraceae bacterium]|nr:T9SS type A sorting domain-containing protein [Saprospiraceae bacterium]
MPTSQAQHLLSSSGGDDQSREIQLSWSLGEPVVTTVTTPGGILTQGFQQPFLRVQEVPPRPFVASELEVQVMPNPVASVVRIMIDKAATQDVTIRWYDLAGQRVDGGAYRFSSGMMEWDVSGFAPGTYVLTVTCDGFPARTFLVTRVD